VSHRTFSRKNVSGHSSVTFQFLERLMLSGRWRNDRGSEMILRQTDHQIVGEYITRIGDDRARDRSAPLVGLASGELVGFVVCFPGTTSLTSWTGRLFQEQGPRGPVWKMHTVWHLAREEVGDPPRKTGVWETFLTNTSVFERIDHDGQ
jgi:hypothetical protein